MLEVTGRETPSHLVSQRKSSIDGLRSGRLSCCSLTSCRDKHRRQFRLSSHVSHAKLPSNPLWKPPKALLLWGEIQATGSHDSRGILSNPWVCELLQLLGGDVLVGTLFNDSMWRHWTCGLSAEPTVTLQTDMWHMNTAGISWLLWNTSCGLRCQQTLRLLQKEECVSLRWDPDELDSELLGVQNNNYTTIPAYLTSKPWNANHFAFDAPICRVARAAAE